MRGLILQAVSIAVRTNFDRRLHQNRSSRCSFFRCNQSEFAHLIISSLIFVANSSCINTGCIKHFAGTQTPLLPLPDRRLIQNAQSDRYNPNNWGNYNIKAGFYKVFVLHSVQKKGTEPNIVQWSRFSQYSPKYALPTIVRFVQCSMLSR
jgi:hypothetical protein